MPEQLIPVLGINSSVDSTVNQKGSIRLADGYIDEQGYLNKRPALGVISTIADTTATAEKYGCLYWPTYNEVIVFKDQGTGGQGGGDYIFTLEQNDTFTQRAVTSTLVSPEVNTGTERYACIARYQGNEILVSARGARMSTYNPVTHAFAPIAVNTGASISGSPAKVERPLYMDGYVIAQAISGNKFYWSAIDDPYTWNPLDFAEAISVADDIVGMEIYGNEIYVFGQQSIEVFYNDGVSPFRRIDSRTLNIGCLVGSSIKVQPEGIYFLDSNRHISMINSQGFTTISNDINSLIKDLQGSGVYYDNNGGYGGMKIHEYYLKNKKLLLCSFPNCNIQYTLDYIQAGLTLVYDTENKQWYEWTSWIKTNGVYGRTGLRVNFSAWAQGQKRTVFLLNRFKKFCAAFYEGYPYTEISDENDVTVASPHLEWKTGLNSWGTPKKKRSTKLKIRTNKSTTIGANDLTLTAYDDDNITLTSRTVSISANYNGNGFTIYNQLGSYYTRAYQFTHNSAAPLILGEVYETIDVVTQK